MKKVLLIAIIATSLAGTAMAGGYNENWGSTEPNGTAMYGGSANGWLNADIGMVDTGTGGFGNVTTDGESILARSGVSTGGEVFGMSEHFIDGMLNLGGSTYDFAQQAGRPEISVTRIDAFGFGGAAALGDDTVTQLGITGSTDQSGFALDTPNGGISGGEVEGGISVSSGAAATGRRAASAMAGGMAEVNASIGGAGM